MKNKREIQAAINDKQSRAKEYFSMSRRYSVGRENEKVEKCTNLVLKFENFFLKIFIADDLATSD